MATSAPLRLDNGLIRAANAAARLQRRTVPRQIEYWAELGRAVEKHLNFEDLVAVREGLARLVVEKGALVEVDPDDVFSALESARVEGTLIRDVTTATMRYQSCPGRPGLLEQITSDGRKTPGRFQNGEFISLDQ